MDMNTLIPTNTFANATFDILKMDGIEDPLINVDKLSAMDLEESYFLKTVNFLKENMSDYTKAKITLYKTISEATSDTVVLEGFSDFFSAIKSIIDKFLKWIKQLFQRFINTLNSLIESDNYLQKNKKVIDKFRSEDEFEIKGYKFTFQDNIPATDIVQDWSASLFDELGNDDAISTEMVRSANSTLNDYNDSYYDKFRGKVLGKEENISSADFAEEMFKIFRDGELDTDSITVDTGYIRLAKDRYFNYKNIISDVKRQQKRIEDAYHGVEKQLKDIISNNGKANPSQFISMLPDNVAVTQADTTALDSEGKFSGEFMTQLDIFIKNKVQQIQEISNIHALAFSVKLDAEKDCFKQDKATLYTALSKIYKNGSKRESVENINEEDK